MFPEKAKCMRFKRLDKPVSWTTLANDFVLNLASDDKVEQFLRAMSQAKVRMERQMREELDQQFMTIPF